MAESLLVHVRGCWVALEAEDWGKLRRAEALLYDGVPPAPDCERVVAEVEERVRRLGVKVAAAWPNPRR